MRVVKPSRLSVLTRPYRRHGTDVLGTAVMALATLDERPALMPEQELWRVASEEAGGLLDLGMPKADPEFLISGLAYTRHQPDKTACAVRARVGGLDKSLLVFGDRYWLDGRATAPEAFDAMRVDWAHTYGGPGHAGNPLGSGMRARRIDGTQAVPLPNVEHPRGRVSRPGQDVPPASFDAIAPDNPARFARMGSRYGQDWLQREFPGFAADMDWHYFNAASPDQWWAGRAEVPAGAEYEIWNMHPDRPVLRGHLPTWRVRCFAGGHGDAPRLREIPMRLSTAWFFPHRDRVLLIWHGALQIAESDAADIAHVMPAIELADASRGMDHYQDVLRRRTDPREGAIHALRDGDLAEAALYADAPDAPLPDIAARPLVRNMYAGAERRRRASRQTLADEGLDPDDFLAPPMTMPPRMKIDDLPMLLEQASQERKKGEALLAQARDTLLRDPDLQRFGEAAGMDVDAIARPDGGGPMAARFDPGALKRQLREFRERFPQAAASRASFAAQADRLYLQTAHLGAAPEAMPPLRARRTRRRISAIHQRTRDFTGMHLVGADLSGLDLRGACFRGASLEGAKLDGACLDDCDFTQAVLARVSMTGGSLARARLQRANIADARFDGVSLEAVDLDQATVESAQFSSCSFAGARLIQTRLGESRFAHCDFRGATLEEAVPLKAVFQACDFREAMLRRCAFMECTLAETAFAHAGLIRCAFVHTGFGAGMDFSDARLEMSSFSAGTVLRHACLDGVELRQCGLRGVHLEGASLARARLHGSDLSECVFVGACLDGIDAAESLFVRADFTGATLRGANLMQSLLGRADFTRADLRDANLFRADVGEAVLDGSTSLDGAYTEGAKLWPRRRTGTAGPAL
ncbi:DUF2169 family type VI secretion system accessory protein [Bordetella genomosp. 11]|uniref:DUF2169 domain-containing protein n=1 Tax=Bordetella genomosp. 11 TaxID=1416808 RepID=A0A261UMS3_9BORD|nr:pentapeptide repeat-containing protein [Bordetella genomosp. 11]OZI63159.1 hypothetical protein CAL28_29140 [Bordetella genomosp. 11]